MHVAGDAAIADAGRSLVAVLREGVAGLVDPDAVALRPPTASRLDRRYRLTLFLYGVAESPHLRNDDRSGSDEDADDADGHPGVALDLRYLLTAHPPRGRDEGDAAAHELLGRAVHVLHENAILDGDDLVGSLAGGPPVHVTTDPDERATTLDVWRTFEEVPYRPSVAYLVTPVVVGATEGEPVATERDDAAEREHGRARGRPDAGEQSRDRGRGNQRGQGDQRERGSQRGQGDQRGRSPRPERE